MKPLRAFATGCGLATLFFLAAAAYCAPPRYGQLTGLVLDPLGQPQLGASVSIDPEGIAGRDANQQITTDQNGSFSLTRLRPGLYAVKVTQVGFLPSMQQHVRVGAGLTTLVRIEMDSVFASLDRLRRQPSQSTQADDWKWVLRTSSATRPVLQFRDGAVLVASGESSSLDGAHQPNARVELTSGSRQPGSPSALSGSPATAVSYDQPLGGIGQVLVAGEMSYEPTGAAGIAFASVWLPSGQFDRGSETTVIVRQTGFGPNRDVTRSMRLEHSGRLVLGDRVTLDYGAAYVAAGIGEVAATVRPRAGLNFRLPSGWTSSLFLESEPAAYGLRERSPMLDSTLDTLDTLPILLGRDGRSAVADNWHEEFAVRHDVSAHGKIEGAAYHDYSRHTAVFGNDGIEGQGPVPVVYAHDGGTESSWGVRFAYTQKLVANMDVAAIYAWAGALAPDSDVDTANPQLSDELRTVNRQSVAVRISGKVPRTKTQIAASYKWIDGTLVSRQDLFGEAAFGLDPNLSLAIQQPLPSFGTVGRHWEAIADFRNLLAQGYVPVNNQGQVVLIPVLRSFRGGVNFQF